MKTGTKWLAVLFILTLALMLGFSLAAKADGNYLTFTGNESFTLSLANVSWDGTLEYSTDAEDWTPCPHGEIPSSESSPFVVYLRGSGNTYVKGSDNSGIGLSKPAACSGNIMTLLNYINPGKTISTDYAFRRLFSRCDCLTGAPSLPAEKLAQYCYQSMFHSCTSLTSAPSLPATELGFYCYDSMFYGCTSLNSLPELPATKLADGCYNGMFCDCTGIFLSDEKGDFNGIAYEKEYRIPSAGTGTARVKICRLYVFGNRRTV